VNHELREVTGDEAPLQDLGRPRLGARLPMWDAQKVGILLTTIVNDSEIGAVHIAVSEKIKRKTNRHRRSVAPR
jgi:hypothetical protein